MAPLAFCALLLLASEARAQSFFPAAIGTTWEYRQMGAVPEQFAVRIAGRETIGGVETLRFETTAEGEVIQTQFIRLEEDGVRLHGRAAQGAPVSTFVPPRQLLPAPLALGTTWELEDDVAGLAMVQKFKVVGSERVRVPAGEFRAFRLRAEEPWPLAISVERWFAPGTGFVKDVTTTRGPTGRLISRVTTVLTRFVPGTAQTTPSPTPSPTPAGPAAFRVVISKERTGPPVGTFASATPNIFVEWKGENLPLHSIVRVVWVAEDVGEVAEPNFVVDEKEIEVTAPDLGARFTLGRPTDGWAPGKYRLELYLDDVLMEAVAVSIAD